MVGWWGGSEGPVLLSRQKLKEDVERETVCYLRELEAKREAGSPSESLPPPTSYSPGQPPPLVSARKLRICSTR